MARVGNMHRSDPCFLVDSTLSYSDVDTTGGSVVPCRRSCAMGELLDNYCITSRLLRADCSVSGTLGIRISSLEKPSQCRRNHKRDRQGACCASRRMAQIGDVRSRTDIRLWRMGMVCSTHDFRLGPSHFLFWLDIDARLLLYTTIRDFTCFLSTNRTGRTPDSAFDWHSFGSSHLRHTNGFSLPGRCNYRKLFETTRSRESIR